MGVLVSKSLGQKIASVILIESRDTCERSSRILRCIVLTTKHPLNNCPNLIPMGLDHIYHHPPHRVGGEQTILTALSECQKIVDGFVAPPTH